ncbi:MAG TPA: cbb3-type cytochrome oxidase assembly protein CcoS [Gammaproteobacteria bacterium]|nr:cbb3-type cytochrome oxidase assembly protein CcoS [Gammaproteobacteria bacterium]
MESIFVLVPVSIVLLAVAIWLFFWATKHGQFDDLDSPAWRILRDDAPARRKEREHD